MLALHRECDLRLQSHCPLVAQRVLCLLCTVSMISNYLLICLFGGYYFRRVALQIIVDFQYQPFRSSRIEL